MCALSRELVESRRYTICLDAGADASLLHANCIMRITVQPARIIGLFSHIKKQMAVFAPPVRLALRNELT